MGNIVFGRFGKGVAAAAQRLAKLNDTPLSAEALDRRGKLERYEGLRQLRVSPADAAGAVGVCLRTIREWQKRVRRRGWHGLEPLSRRPHRRREGSKCNDLLLRRAVRELRLQSPFGKEKLGVLLRRQGWEVSASTIGRILVQLRRRREVQPVHVGKRRRALGKGQKRPHAQRYRQPAAYRTFGECVQMDTLTATLANGKAVKIFTAVDGCSRYAWAMATMNATAQAGVRFLDLLPACVRIVQTDGGPEFMGELELTCPERGILQVVLPPRSPHLNGRVEAFNGTLRREFLNVCGRAQNLAELNEQLAPWLKFYNEQRPHWALSMQSPIQFMPKRPSPTKSATC